MTDKDQIRKEREAHAETAKKLAAVMIENAKLKQLCKTHGLMIDG